MRKLGKFILVSEFVFIGILPIGNACDLVKREPCSDLSCPDRNQFEFEEGQPNLSSNRLGNQPGQSSNQFGQSSSRSGVDNTNRKRSQDEISPCSTKRFKIEPYAIPMNRSLISDDWWMEILSYLSDSEQIPVRVSKGMNSVIQATREHTLKEAITKNTSLEVRRSIEAGRRWADLHGLSKEQAYLHDRNFWRGFLTFLHAANLWNVDDDLMALEDTETTQITQLRSQIDFYWERLKPGSLAELILKSTSKFLSGLTDDLENICASTDLHAQADNGYSSAQDVLGFCYLHGIGVHKNFTRAKRYATLAAKDEIAANAGILSHPKSTFSSQKIRYLELVNDIEGYPFKVEFLATYREILKNPFASIEIKRHIRRRAQIADEIDREIEFAECILAPCTDWFCRLQDPTDISDERALALAYLNKQKYHEASQWFDRILSHSEDTLPEVVLEDKRYASTAHWGKGDSVKALEIEEQILNHPSASLSDRRRVAERYFQSKNYKRSAELWEQVLLVLAVPPVAVEDRRNAAQDKRNAATAYFKIGQLASYIESARLWDEVLALVGREATLDDRRNVAAAHFKSNHFEKSALLWGKCLAYAGPKATLHDKRDAAIAFAKDGQHARSAALEADVRVAEQFVQIAHDSSATAMTGRQE